MAVKASRQSVSLPICRVHLRQTFFCFREAKSKLADLSLPQGGLMTKLGGGRPNQQRNESAAAFLQKIYHCKQYIQISAKKALKSPEIAEFIKLFVLKLFHPAYLILNTPRRYLQYLRVCVWLNKRYPDVSCFLETSGTVYCSRIISVVLFSLVREVGKPFK